MIPLLIGELVEELADRRELVETETVVVGHSMLVGLRAP